MIISAKFATKCKVCGREIQIGDRISWQRGQKGSAHEQCSDEGKTNKQAVEASRATHAEISVPCPESLEFLEYQKAGIAFALGRVATLIADEMGLGKTVQAIGVINTDTEIKSVLVVCPASLKYNWQAEIMRWCTRDFSCAIFPQRISGVQTMPDCTITIINYDQLKKLSLPLEPWDLLIVDEAHYAKNSKAQRTVLLGKMARFSRRKIFLTGTPILNRPVELWPLLQMLDADTWDPAIDYAGIPAGSGRGFFRFAKRYCNAREVWHGRSKHWDFTGSSNLDELQQKLRSSIMIRRLKKDVLKELPAKRRQVVLIEAPIDMNDEGAFETIRAETLGGTFEEAVELLATKKVGFADWSKSRHTSALLKVPACIAHIRECLESSDKIVVFCHHKDVAQALEDEFHDVGGLKITGDTEPNYRNFAVEKFQNDPSCRIIIGTIGAMGVGLTLTAASHVIFCEYSPVPGECSQAEDRCHRIGQDESVLIQILVADKSIDAKIAHIVVAKQEVLDLALDEVTPELDLSTREYVAPPPTIDFAVRDQVHAALRYLAARCDGAVELDGQGFNALDSAFGKSLAACTVLSGKQTLAGKRILQKYRGQLGGNFPLAVSPE